MGLTIKEISKKYGIEYYIVYTGMSEAGLLKFGKGCKYDEMAAVAAVFRYLTSRIDRHKAKIYEYLEIMEQLGSCLKKEKED